MLSFNQLAVYSSNKKKITQDHRQQIISNSNRHKNISPCHYNYNSTPQQLTIDPSKPPDLAQCLSLFFNYLKDLNNRNLQSLTMHRARNERRGYFCVLCKKNGEIPEFYQSHTLHDDQGKVICPVLIKYKCQFCGATGEKAHTRSYCPVARNLRNRLPNNPHVKYLCTNLADIQTDRNSVGKIRRLPVKQFKQQ